MLVLTTPHPARRRANPPVRRQKGRAARRADGAGEHAEQLCVFFTPPALPDSVAVSGVVETFEKKNRFSDM